MIYKFGVPTRENYSQSFIMSGKAKQKTLQVGVLNVGM